jgi:hypothetical protein
LLSAAKHRIEHWAESRVCDKARRRGGEEKGVEGWRGMHKHAITPCDIKPNSLRGPVWRADGRAACVVTSTREASADNDNNYMSRDIVVYTAATAHRWPRTATPQREGLAGTTISRGAGERRAGLLRIVYGASLAGRRHA